MKFLTKKNLSVVVSSIILLIMILPGLTFAADSLVPCGNSTTVNGVTTIPAPCDFEYFIMMINGIINWIIGIATVIFTISAIYGGFLYLTSGDKPGNKDKAKSILWSTLTGFVIILVSWLIIFTILNALIPKDDTHKYIFQFIGGIRY